MLMEAEMSHNVLPMSLRPQSACDVIGTYSKDLRTEEASGTHPPLTVKIPPPPRGASLAEGRRCMS